MSPSSAQPERSSRPDAAASAAASPQHTIHPLTDSEVRERVARGEANVSEARTSRSLGAIVYTNVFTRVNVIYATLLILVLSTGSFLDAMFGLLIVVNSVVGMIQELRAKRTLDRLALLNRAPIRVERAGGVREVASDEVVLDDVVVLGAGDQIAVDGTLLDGTGLEIDESLLTGEADPVLPESGGAVLSGSFVVAGSGRIVATAVGPASYAEKLAAEASTFRKPSSQLRAGIDKILKYIMWILVPVGLLTVWNQLAGGQEWRDAIRGLVAALVPMVPEGLVLMTSVAMAVGVIRLGRRNCLVQDLPAIEQLARVDVFCTDKTGTLTEDGMRVSRVEHVASGVQDQLADPGPAAGSPAGSGRDPNILAVLATVGVAEGKPTSSMAAVLEHVGDEQPLPASRYIAFSSARKWAAVQLAEPLADGLSWVFGAPDVMLAPNDDSHARADELSAEGHRVLALASSPRPMPESGLPEELSPVALVVLDQRLRAEVPDAIRYFREQGVELKVISGDNAAAVGAIAEKAGVPEGRVAVDARGLDPASANFADEVASHSAFGRVTPTQKRAMVHALQSERRIVGMTGDGVNDVFALKDADVGVAMGSGSPAARAVSRIVLLDNSFAALPHVVAEGRRVIGNIERVATLFLTKTFYSVLLAFLVVATAIPYPFLPRHVTLISVFTIGVPAFFLALAPNTARAQDGFVRRVLGQAVPGGLGAAFAAYGAYAVARAVFGVDAATRVMNSSTALLALLVVAFFVLIAVARPFRLWKSALIAALMACVLTVLVTPLGRMVFDIDLRDWRAVALALGFGAGGILLRTLAALLLRRR